MVPYYEGGKLRVMKSKEEARETNMQKSDTFTATSGV